MIPVALYRNERDSRPYETLELEWGGVVDLLSKHEPQPCAPCPGKDCPYKYGKAWSAVSLRPCPERCHKHGLKGDCGGGREHRLNANVEAVHLAVFDVDDADAAALAGILERLDAEGLDFLVHSSHSYAPPARCKVRILLPVSRPVLPTEWPRLWRAASERLGLPGDKATRDLARLWFFPTHPGDVEPLVVVGEGAPLDVDALLALASPAVATNATASGSTTYDLEPLRERLRQLRSRYARSASYDDKERHQLLDRVLRGEPLAEEGGRDTAVNRLAGIVATALHPDTPLEALQELVRLSVDALPGPPPDGGGTWLDEFAAKLDRARERRRASDEQERADREAKRERAMALMRQHAGGPAEEAPPAPKAEGSVEPLDKHRIIQHGRTYWVRSGGRYKAPVTRDDLAVCLYDDLSYDDVPLEVEDAHGHTRRMRVSEILDRYASVARHVHASLSLQQSVFDPVTETFTEALTPLRRLTAREHPEVHRWLCLLGGADRERLLDWVASVTRLDRQLAALYLAGAKGAGKTVFATGLARLWSTHGFSVLARVLGDGFNDSLALCPLVFGDETLPQERGVTAKLRALIGSTTHSLRRLYRPTMLLTGAVRVILAGNNDRLLDVGDELSADDLAAVSQRILYVHTSQEAAQYLEDVGGPPTIEAWLQQDWIAEHALWLRDTRSVADGKRFLVEGVQRDFHEHLATNTGIAGLVCEFVVRYLSDAKTIASAKPAVYAGGGEVWVSTDGLSDKDAWEVRVAGAKVPSAAKIGRALANLAIRKVRIRYGGQQTTYQVCRGETFLAWAERQVVGDVAQLQRRIHGARELKGVLEAATEEEA